MALSWKNAYFLGASAVKAGRLRWRGRLWADATLSRRRMLSSCLPGRSSGPGPLALDPGDALRLWAGATPPPVLTLSPGCGAWREAGPPGVLWASR